MVRHWPTSSGERPSHPNCRIKVRSTIGKTLVNIVCLELLRRRCTVRVGIKKSKEVGFVGIKQEKKMYVQVAYLLGTPETAERAFSLAFLVILLHPLLNKSYKYPILYTYII